MMQSDSFCRATQVVSFVLLVLFSASCSKSPPSQLEQARALGELRMVTRNDATTYFIGPQGKSGFEYQLAHRFADQLGIPLKLIVASSLTDILPMVEKGEAHFAAAGLTVTPARAAQVQFGPTYQIITQHVVYREGKRRPRSIEDLVGSRLEVIAGSSYAERLRELKSEHPDLTWAERELSSEEINELVWIGAIDYTITDSNILAQLRRIYPELRIAFDISGHQALAWAFPPGDDSLVQATQKFFNKLRDSGELEHLIDQHYGHTGSFDYVDSRTFLRHITDRLPNYRQDFGKAAETHEFDWRLLAALSYQESKWNPKARSPTGVRGMMMLTRVTAREVGVENRLDPHQSISGGSAYLRDVLAKIPERIPEPDRTWLALAAYNVGFGHLEDARRLTEAQGFDPDKWIDVRKHLPLLSRKAWYAKTRYGYARGAEPVHFVRNIRRYYDVLVWLTGRKRPQQKRPVRSVFIDSPVL